MTRPLAALVTVFLAACGGAPRSTETTRATTATTTAPSPIHRFRVGALEAIALKDGDIQAPNDGTMLGVGQTPEAVGDVLAAAGLERAPIHLSIEPLLVRDGEHTFLFDTGAGNASFADAGKLPTSMRAAGVEPSEISDIFISHGHPDHVGGLVTHEGALVFANATIHLSEPEWAAMQANAELASLVTAITPKVVAFAPGATLFPSVTAVAIQGHTPGHSGYDISSGDAHLLFIGDAAHHSVISVQRPDWTIAFDMHGDEPVARATRRALLQRAATEDLRLYAGHFPFPGLGRVRPDGESFVWVPE